MRLIVAVVVGLLMFQVPAGTAEPLLDINCEGKLITDGPYGFADLIRPSKPYSVHGSGTDTVITEYVPTSTWEGKMSVQAVCAALAHLLKCIETEASCTTAQLAYRQENPVTFDSQWTVEVSEHSSATSVAAGYLPEIPRHRSLVVGDFIDEFGQ